MTRTIPVLTNQKARRIFLQRHLLANAPSGKGRGDELAGVIEDLGFVQLDSVNTFARAHDLILWSRRQQYRPRALENLLSRDRKLFEHWTHDASTIPIQFFPMWRIRFERAAKELEARWAKDRRAGFLEKTHGVLKQISDEGCCCSADVGRDEEKKSGGWWDWHPSKTALEYLWHSGQLSVVRREGFRKIYDLTERVIPPEYLNAYVDERDAIDWHCNAALDRLGFATSGEISAFWATVTKQEAKEWCARELSEGRIVEIDVEGTDGTLRRSFARPELMDEQVDELSPRVRLLSPFDPALRDRKRAERLFGFNYRIEIFVPAAKRTYGYYVFPVMEGERLIGRVDMKADRPGKVLNVTAFWPEEGVRMGVGRISRLHAELQRACGLGACQEVQFQDGWLRKA
ncbi:hypothetical protein SAMN05444003_1839 [Cognatiyoonia sediminum]|uniref:Winged helix-turn-helix domain-containing protein n=1 Tax=Cognatiyoonia sediminum TaxID=1508389 RepID=A0A1M5PTA1_9RHOB|nr:crosslink repair DNA glycosylase YcaQ family protein [Cognatiyoonia sediminum]SHH05115.1 hypothetical protein SAMN05444003_1839 [Cognatiyoonia sediminum]